MAGLASSIATRLGWEQRRPPPSCTRHSTSSLSSRDKAWTAHDLTLPTITHLADTATRDEVARFIQQYTPIIHGTTSRRNENKTPCDEEPEEKRMRVVNDAWHMGILQHRQAWPRLRAEAARIRTCVDKRGFVLVKSLLPPSTAKTSYNTHISSILLSCALGHLLSQDASGQKIGMVYERDAALRMETGARYHHTRQGGSLHTDNVATQRPWDALVMSCLQPPLIGGESIVCSAVTLHEYLRKHAPRALQILREPFRWEPRGFSSTNGSTCFEAPIFYDLPTRSRKPEPAIRYLRPYLESANQLSTDQRWAMDALDAAMNLSQNQFRFALDPGDHLVLSANQTLHGRTEFIDPQPIPAATTSVGIAPAISKLDWVDGAGIFPRGKRLLTRAWIAYDPLDLP